MMQKSNDCHNNGIIITLQKVTRVIQELMTMTTISQKVLLDSLFFVMSHVDTDITCSRLKLNAFIMASFDAMII